MYGKLLNQLKKTSRIVCFSGCPAGRRHSSEPGDQEEAASGGQGAVQTGRATCGLGHRPHLQGSGRLSQRKTHELTEILVYSKSKDLRMTANCYISLDIPTRESVDWICFWQVALCLLDSLWSDLSSLTHLHDEAGVDDSWFSHIFHDGNHEGSFWKDVEHECDCRTAKTQLVWQQKGSMMTSWSSWEEWWEHYNIWSSFHTIVQHNETPTLPNKHRRTSWNWVSFLLCIKRCATHWKFQWKWGNKTRNAHVFSEVQHLWMGHL